MKQKGWKVWGCLAVLTVALALAWNHSLIPTPFNSTADAWQPAYTEREASVAESDQQESLRILAENRGMRIGVAVQGKPLQEEPAYGEVLAREFNQITPENAMKFRRVHPERDRYDFTEAGELVRFAQAHAMKIHGHTLVWHANLPEWVTATERSREEWIALLRQHIYTVVGHFRGQVEAWDVVNEAMGRRWSLRESPWLNGIGPEYIELAFRWAHEADPAARLFYNDHDGEAMGIKSDAIYDLVKQLRQRDVPIHGVGLQMHLTLKDLPDPQQIAANIQRLGELGLEVRITEMDVQSHDEEGLRSDKLSSQANIYREILRICLQAPNCTALTTWGVADHLSWIPYSFNRPDSPLLFDRTYQPKPAYRALQDLLRNGE